MRNRRRDFADGAGYFKLVLEPVGQCGGRHAAEQRIDVFETIVESEIGSLLFAQLQVLQQGVTRVQVVCASRRLLHGNDQLVLVEQRIRRITEQAARKPAFKFQPLRLVSGEQAQAPSLALLGVVDHALVESGDRLQRSAQRGGFQAQSAGTLVDELESERGGKNLVFAAIEAEKVIPSDNAGPVERGQ